LTTKMYANAKLIEGFQTIGVKVSYKLNVTKE
jgi:hypothetical protein